MPQGPRERPLRLKIVRVASPRIALFRRISHVVPHHAVSSIRRHCFCDLLADNRIARGKNSASFLRNGFGHGHHLDRPSDAGADSHLAQTGGEVLCEFEVTGSLVLRDVLCFHVDSIPS